MFLDILRLPDIITAFDSATSIPLQPHGETWTGEGIAVTVRPPLQDNPDAALVSRQAVYLFAPEHPLSRIVLRWNLTDLPENLLVVGDHWERGYGDLEWRGLVPERNLPWYFLVYDPKTRLTVGYGVETGAGSFCHWNMDSDGITLTLDVRCGGSPVRLGERQLHAATIVNRIAESPDEDPVLFSQLFCATMAVNPIFPTRPIYGGNNWYYAYGNSSHVEILADSQRMIDVAPLDTGNLPFMVIDEGWQLSRFAGPWHLSNRKFPDMARLATEMRQIGVEPGIWMRPLLTTESLPDSWFLPKSRFPFDFDGRILDPTIPEAQEQIASDIRTLSGWGYSLIKHDFSTYDLLGKWGFEMDKDITPAGWHFQDRGKTTAEVIRQLYQVIRDAAGKETLILGCNTVGHLAVGLVEIQRTGDDTSGREWERTRKMGINTLAFRMGQHGTFFHVDADCVGLTKMVPWELNRQWLDLLARSGTPLFVSAAPDAVGEEQEDALRKAFALAATDQSTAEPIDWLFTTCPRRWRTESGEVTYRWF